MEPLSNNLEENYDRFLVEAIDCGLVWGLCDEGGNWALAPSLNNEQMDVMPFWSQREFAEAACTGEWSVYRATAIDLEEFLDDWLPSMHSDLYLVGINWNAELDGDECEPLDLAEDFEAEL